jgi:hypothetical protein
VSEVVSVGESAAGALWRLAWCDALGAEALPTGTLRLTPSGPAADAKGGHERAAGTGAVASLRGFAEGAWWVQDGAAATPALALVSALRQRAATAVQVEAAAAREAVLASAAGGHGGGGSGAAECGAGSVADLKARCRAAGLAVGGRKQALIDRLAAHLAAVAHPARTRGGSGTSSTSTSISSTSTSSSSSSGGTSGGSSSPGADHPALAKGATGQGPLARMRVADVCAAPGGKTAQLLCAGFGHVTAVRGDDRARDRRKSNQRYHKDTRNGDQRQHDK